MPRERRPFEQLPDYLKTTHNNREYWITDDPLYEPERAEFVIGWIGDTDVLSEEDLQRTPPLPAPTPARERYQLTIGATYIDPATQERQSGAFYQDLVGQIEANGGIVGDDPNRVFSTNFYSWAPPFDFDKHVNFGRYFWTGAGAADVNGEYVTKEPVGSRTVLHEWTGSDWVTRIVSLNDGLPVSGSVGDYAEDSSGNVRRIFRWDGIQWVGVDFLVSEELPEDTSDLDPLDTYYLCRTGPDYNRPIVWEYTEESGRWHPRQVVIAFDPPAFPREGMLWEDASIGTERTFKRYTNGFWAPLSYDLTATGPSAPGEAGDYLYDIRDRESIDDEWGSRNWWRHAEDLSSTDITNLNVEDQATRPIIEFWHGVEQVAGDTRDERNQSPQFKKYAFDPNVLEMVDTGETTTIYEYQRGTGQDDFVLGFPLNYNQDGEFLFELTLESDASAFIGYKFFKDTTTGLVHGVWHKSVNMLMQEQDEDGFWSIPKSITSNPDHVTLTEISRARYLRHFGSIIESQDDFTGSQFGPNSWRWSKKDPAIGATIIDNEQSLLRALALLQTTEYNLPDIIRNTAGEYNRVLFKFENMLTIMWNALTFNGPDDTLNVSAEDACDIVLTRLFIGRNDTFPYYYSDMGTFVQKQIFSGVIDVVDPTEQPIYIPPSAPRVGTAKAYRPTKFTDINGVEKLKGHDGSLRDAYGDDRDLVWLELQSRFFDAVPPDQTTESTTFSGRFLSSNFFLQDYYGNYLPTTSVEPVDRIVQDYNTAVPVANERVFSSLQGVYATYTGTGWLTRQALTDDVFLNQDDGEYYIFNGLGTFPIQSWNRPFDFDYADNEFRRIIRREFERWVISRNLDFMTNDTFVESDKFTWNYGSAGVEGHYRGQYRRLYNTVRPHSHPWEVMGYSIEPDWWRIIYVPDSTAADGTPRYGNAHPMWADFQAGIINPISGTVRDSFKLVAPIPVDAAGELLDPITAGVVDEGAIDKQRIEDTWVYGDGAPTEELFYESPEYPFAVALAGYLMKNGIWLDTTWTEVFIEIGLFPPNQVFNAPHLVHRQTLTRPSLADLPVHLETDENGDTVQRVGVNAWVSESVRIGGRSPESDFGDLLRGTAPALSWRCSGFINGDRTIVRTLSGKEVPFEDVHVVLHQSQPVRSTFASGVLITREEPGYRVWGFDTFNPVFTIELPAVPVVGGQATLTEETVAVQDQHVFTVENITLPQQNRPASDTAGFAVMVDGLPLKPQHVKINSKTEYEIEPIVNIDEGAIVSVQVILTQSNPSTQTRQFFTSQGVAFPYFTKGTGQYINVEYGRFFSSAVDVVNFLLGYGRWLESEGWQFPEAAPDGSERLDYLYVARMFAEWVVDVESPWNPRIQTPPEDRFEFRASPFSEKAVFSTPVGQTLNVESIQYGAFGIVDQFGAPIPTDETVVSRVGPEMTVEAVADSEIYGVRALVTEIEHVVFFSNITQFNDIMYDPPSALFHRTLRVDSYRSQDWNGRLEADGFLINGGELLPNFEKQAKDIIKFYDRYEPVDDPEKSRQAKNLYGWYPLDEYMDPIDADERARFDYYRGMIKAKGSRRAFKAYWRGTRLGTDDIFLYEEWAWLLAQFGDPRRSEHQFRVGKNDFTKEFQVIAFVDEEDPNNNTLEVVPFDRNATPIDGSLEDITNRTGNGRWIRPPLLDEDGDGKANIMFPIDPNTGLPSTAVDYYAKLFEEESLNNLQSYFHYDPAAEKYEPVGVANIDYITITDPARYNQGPDAQFSGGRIWTDDRVGQLWWNVERNTYVDYRSLLDDYETASSEWGRLEYLNARIERTNQTATVTTLNPFVPFDTDGTPNAVEHGLRLGQRISVRGATDDEYNVEDLIVEFEQVFAAGIEVANSNEATGTIDFSLTEAVGTVQAPVYQPGDGFIIETQSGVQEIILVTGGLLDATVQEINDLITLKEVTVVNIGGKLAFQGSSGNETEWFTLRETTYQYGCTGSLTVVPSDATQLIKIEMFLNGVDQANGNYLGLAVNALDNVIDDIRVIDEFGTVQITSTVGHFFLVGDEVRISGVNQSEYNGTFTVDQVETGIIRVKNDSVVGQVIPPGTGDMLFSRITPTTTTFAQNIVLAINRETTNSGFFAEYLNANIFRVCSMQSREDAEQTEVKFTFDIDLEVTQITPVDASDPLFAPNAAGDDGKYFRLFSANNVTSYYVWYRVALGGAAQQIQYETTAASTLSSGAGTDADHIRFNSANNATQYYAWFDVDGIMDDPAPLGLTGIRVEVAAGDSDEQVALKAKDEIDALSDFDAVASATPGSPSKTVIPTTPEAILNATPDVKYFNIWVANNTNPLAPDYYVWYDVDGGKTDPGGGVNEIVDITCSMPLGSNTAADNLTSGAFTPGKYFSLWEAGDVAQNWVWYSVTDPTVQEESQITCGDASTLTQDTGTPGPLPGDYFRIYAGGDTTSYYAWYDVTITSPLPEITDVICGAASGLTPDDGSGTIPGDYWFLYSADDATNYYVWYNVTDVGLGNANPSPGGTGIEIQVQVADSNITVAQKTGAQIQTQFPADFTGTDDGAGMATITNVNNGHATNSSDFNTGFTVTPFQQGIGTPNSDPAPGGTGIQIPVDDTDSPSAVATKTALALDALGAFTATSISQVVDVIHNVGAVTSNTAIGTLPGAFSVSTPTEGAGTPNVDPAPAWTGTGIMVEVLPVDDEQQVASKTAAALNTFNTGTVYQANFNGTITIPVENTTAGATTDASDVNTGFGFSVSQQGAASTLVGTPVRVNLSSGDTADDVAFRTSVSLNALSDFNAGLSGNVVTCTNTAVGPSNITTDGPSPNNTDFAFVFTNGASAGTVANFITITNTEVGETNPPSIGTTPFSVSIITPGKDPGSTVDPLPSGFDQSIPVDIFETDLSADIAWKTATVLNLLPDFNAGASGNVVNIVNVDGGDATDAADINTTFTFFIPQQGTTGTIDPLDDFFFTYPTSQLQGLLIARSGFNLKETADQSIRETTYPVDKQLTGTIVTKSGTYEFDSSTFEGWKLDDLIETINIRDIPEILAANKNGIATIGNPDDNLGQAFLLDGELFTAVGIDTSFLYGDFPPQSGMRFLVGRKNVEFVTEGGTLDVLVPEINAFLALNEIDQIQASNTGNRLVIENTVNFKGTTFTLRNPSTVTTSILELTDIPEGVYEPDPTKFEYEINGEPESPARGTPLVRIGFIDVYEWVKSPVPPEDWEQYTASLTAPDAPTGTVLNPEDPSYVSVDTVLPSGGTETSYYFWVQNNTGRNIAKDYTTEEVRQRLEIPSTLGIPWFSPMDANHMLVFAANRRIVDGNAIEVIFDDRREDTHYEWQLVAEGSLFQEIPQEIVDKMIDSMEGVDKYGNVVPDPNLSASERYGSFFVPRQTVFRDVETARDVWLEALNTILRRRNFAAEERLTVYLPVEIDGTPVENYWNKAWYVEEAYENEEIFDDVPNVAARDERDAAGFYAVGDLVKVDTTEGALSEFRDLWDATAFVGALYVKTDTGWSVVGVENFTFELNDNLFGNDDFREVYYNVYGIIDIGERNDIMFTMLYEMQRQSIPCDWFFKTSYIQSQMFAQISADPFVRASEFDSVIANIRDIKPYRTKLRSDQVTTTLRDLEDFPVDIDEFPDKKITLLIDRLSCNAAEEGGWDGYPWDLEPLGFDVPIWEYEDLGRAEFYEIGEVFADASSDSFILYPSASPQLYPHRLEVYLSGEIIEEDAWPTAITVNKGPNSMTIETADVLPVGYSIIAYLARGFYHGTEPSLGVDLEDTLFEPAESSYEHALVRRIGIDYPAYRNLRAQTRVFSGNGTDTVFVPGLDVDNEFAFIEILVVGSDSIAVKQEFNVDYTIPAPGVVEFAVAPPAPPVDHPGGNIYCYLSCNPNLTEQDALPQERIRATVIDSVNICVKTFNTPLYGAWDLVPWDTSPWDREPFTGDSSYRVLVGQEEVIPPGIEILPTSEDVTAGSTQYIFGSSELYGILAVYVQSGGVGPFNPTTETVDWNFVDDFQHIIEFTGGLSSGDVVRLIFGNWFVGNLGTYKILSAPVLMDYADRNIVATVEPPANDTLTVQFQADRRGPAPISRLTTMEEVVVDIVADKNTIQPGNGSYDNTAYDGMRIIETNTAQLFQFVEATQQYSSLGTVTIGVPYLVTRKQEIWQYDGTNFTKLFQVGDATPVPPVLDWPLVNDPIIPYGGYGVIGGHIYLGTAPGADVQWPLSKQIVDASGPICTDFESPDYNVPEDLVVCGYEPPIEPPVIPEPPEPPEPPVEEETPCEGSCPTGYKGIYVTCCP